jgi:hypothetical protein
VIPFRYIGVDVGVSGLTSARAFDHDDREIARLAGGKWRAVVDGVPADAFYNHMDVDTEPVPQRRRDEELL